MASDWTCETMINRVCYRALAAAVPDGPQVALLRSVPGRVQGRNLIKFRIFFSADF